MRRGLAIMFFIGLVALIAWMAQDATTPAELDRLNARVVELYRQGQYTQALPLAQRVVAIAEDRYGPEHPDTAGSLNTLAELYRKKARTPGPSPCTDGRWASGKRRWAPSIRTPRRALTIWRSCIASKPTMPGPSP